jgi:hypothetical protein
VAEDLTVDRPRPMALPEPPKPERRGFIHARRFAFAYLLLVIALGVGAALLVAALQMETEGDRQWSTWQPTAEDGTAQLEEIARHVAARYDDGGDRLPFQAIPGPPQARVRSGTDGAAEEIPLDAAVITGRESDAVRLNTAVAYSVCGRGQNCQLTPEAVQREFGAALNGVLELALYTFKYIDDVESLVFFMPPVPATGEEAGDDGLIDTVVFVRKDDLEEQLGEPLSATTIDTSGEIGSDVLDLIRPRLYTFSYDATSQGASLLRLTPYGTE